jgi:thiaminase/transcriptional activator TenA
MTATPRSAALVERNRGRLEQSLEGRFIREASSATLEPRHFARYLAIEERFVMTAVRVSGFTLFAEPDWASVPHHAATIETLLGEQLDYFQAVRARHGDAAADIERAVDRSNVLSDYVLGSIDAASYTGAIVNMFAAETLYLEWCTRATARPLSPALDADSWIALHVTPAFQNQVRALGEFVDRLPTEGSTGGASDDALDSLFVGMLSAEDEFHDAIYLTGE